MFIFTLTFVDYFFNLQKDRMLEIFGSSYQIKKDSLESYIAPSFGFDNLTHYLNRKKIILNVAENRIVKLKQLIRFFSASEFKLFWKANK